MDYIKDIKLQIEGIKHDTNMDAIRARADYIGKMVERLHKDELVYRDRIKQSRAELEDLLGKYKDLAEQSGHRYTISINTLMYQRDMLEDILQGSRDVLDYWQDSYKQDKQDLEG